MAGLQNSVDWGDFFLKAEQFTEGFSWGGFGEELLPPRGRLICLSLAFFYTDLRQRPLLSFFWGQSPRRHRRTKLPTSCWEGTPCHLPKVPHSRCCLTGNPGSLNTGCSLSCLGKPSKKKYGIIWEFSPNVGTPHPPLLGTLRWKWKFLGDFLKNLDSFLGDFRVI